MAKVTFAFAPFIPNHDPTMPFVRIQSSLYNTDTILSIDIAEGGDATVHFVGGSQKMFPDGDFQILEKFLDVRPPPPKPSLFS